jgi:hypothetical protein
MLRSRDDQVNDKLTKGEILKKGGKSPPRKPITPNQKSKLAPLSDAPQNNAPPQNNAVGDIQQQVRGDSQIAPQVKK